MAPTPELLLPAGSLTHMRYAFAYGADAVYAGQPRYSLRVRNNRFDLAALRTGIGEAHTLGRKFYVASNLMAHNAKLKTYLVDMAPVIEAGPDALIMADPGLIMMLRERWPTVPIHLSVQANTVNYAAVKFWKSLGLQRVILSRELSLEEIAEIRQQCPDMELEVFVHGALCIAYSGRCLLSGYFNHRDPNQGSCTNACRWEYRVHDAATDDTGGAQRIDFDAMAALRDPLANSTANPRHPRADRVYLIEERERPGEYMPISEDEHGTYIMNSRDLRAVHHVGQLTAMGIDSFKIEGRTKSWYYVARVAQIYRQAIDDAVAGRDFDPALIQHLDGLANRGYTDGFYQRHAHPAMQNYLSGTSEHTRQQFVGEVTGYQAKHNRLTVLAKNKFAVGDRLELISPAGNLTVIADYIETEDGRVLMEVPGGGYRVHLQLALAPSATHDAAPRPIDTLQGHWQRGLLARHLD